MTYENLMNLLVAEGALEVEKMPTAEEILEQAK